MVPLFVLRLLLHPSEQELVQLRRRHGEQLGGVGWCHRRLPGGGCADAVYRSCREVEETAPLEQTGGMVGS